MPQSFTVLQPEGETVVEVKRSAGGKADDSTKQLLARAEILDEHLESCIGALKSSTATASCFGWRSPPAGTSQATVVLERERKNLRDILNDIVELASTRSAEVDALRSRLTEAEKALLAARIPQHEEVVVDLQIKVQTLEAEKSELQKTILKLSRTRDLTSARLRDLTSDYQGIAEKAELELRRLEADLVKAEDVRQNALAESQEKSRELRNFQKRYDTMKNIAESHREAVVAAKKQADETAASHAKALEAQARRIAEARAGREAAVAELETLRREHAALHDAFVSAGGVEYQISIIRKAIFSRSSGAGGGVLSGGGSSGGRVMVRNLLRGRQGWCVHGRPCGGAAAAGDGTKLTPLAYESQVGLEALMRGQELFLCPTCLANGSFRAL